MCFEQSSILETKSEPLGIFKHFLKYQRQPHCYSRYGPKKECKCGTKRPAVASKSFLWCDAGFEKLKMSHLKGPRASLDGHLGRINSSVTTKIRLSLEVGISKVQHAIDNCQFSVYRILEDRTWYNFSEGEVIETGKAEYSQCSKSFHCRFCSGNRLSHLNA